MEARMGVTGEQPLHEDDTPKTSFAEVRDSFSDVDGVIFSRALIARRGNTLIVFHEDPHDPDHFEGMDYARVIKDLNDPTVTLTLATVTPLLRDDNWESEVMP